MNRVLPHIESRIDSEIKNHPFMHWLASITKDTSEIEMNLKSWIPCAVYWVMGFKDMNQLIMPYPDEEARADPLKAAINEHCKEDGGHWPWLLRDLKTLDLNPTTDWVTLLKFLWGKQTVKHRQAVYAFVRAIDKMEDPLIRYCFIETIEKAGHVFFVEMTKMANILENETGKKLFYYGQTHLDHEDGHVHSPIYASLEQEVWTRSLNDEDFEKAICAVDEGIRIIECMFKELREFGRKSEIRA